MTRSKKSIYKNQVIYWLSRTQSWNEVHTNNDRAEKITLWNKCVNLSDIGRILTFPIIRINYCKLQGLSISASTALSLTASFTPTLWCWMSTAKFASGNRELITKLLERSLPRAELFDADANIPGQNNNDEPQTKNFHFRALMWCFFTLVRKVNFIKKVHCTVLYKQVDTC